MLSSAQQNAFGIETGYGKSYFGETQIFPFPGGHYNAFKLGVRYYRTPANAPFNLYGECSLMHNQYQDFRIGLLTLPVGVQFDFGKRLHFLIGTGLNLKFLLYYNDEDFDPNQILVYENDMNRTQLAWHFSGGIGYKISEKIDLCVQYENTHDLTVFYTKPWQSPGGSSYTVDGKNSIGILNCSIKFFLEGKEK